MRCVVTGAAGFLGSHVCEQLLSRGHEVVGVDCFTSYYSSERKAMNIAPLRRKGGFTLVAQDVMGADFQATCRRVDVVCHFAGRPGVRDGKRRAYWEGNVATTAAVLAAAAASGVPRVLLASSSSVYAPASAPVREDAALGPISVYGRSKLRAERVAGSLAAAHGVELVMLRYFTVYGPRQRPDMAFARFLAAAKESVPMTIYGAGDHIRDFTYVGDAATATTLAIERGRAGAVYNVAGGAPVTLAFALERMADLSGVNVRRVHLPANQFEVATTAANLDRSHEDLGYRPAVSLQEGVSRQIAHSRGEEPRIAAAVLSSAVAI